MANYKKSFFLAALIVLIGYIGVAQELPPPGAPPPPGLPIDGGLLFGVFFALVYGVTKLLKKKE